MRFMLKFATGVAFATMSAGVLADSNPRAERMYNTYCVQCHGVQRNGKGVNAAHMSVQPRDHSDAKGMSDIPDDQLFKAIREGGLAVDKSVLMPAWKSVLSDDDIHGLVAYLREVCKCGPGYN